MLIMNQKTLQKTIIEGINDIKTKLDQNKILEQLLSTPTEKVMKSNKRKVKEGFTVSK